MSGPLRKTLSRRAGVVGAVVGVAAAGIAAGVATERYVMGRVRRGDDPNVDEPFDQFVATRTVQVTTAGGVPLHVEVDEPGSGSERGSGRDPVTLVFVHGFCLTMGTFHFQRSAFRDRYRMVFYDQPGHGRSGRIVQGEYSIDSLGAALRTVIETTAPQGRIVLIGHSMGGMAIMALAQSWPATVADRVAGVVLISTSAGEMGDGLFGVPLMFTRLRRPLQPVIRFAGPATAVVVDRARRTAADLSWLLIRRYGFGRERRSPALVSYVERMISNMPLDVIVRYLETIRTHDRLKALAALRGLPVLVLSGDLDAVTPAAHSQVIARALPQARLVLIEDAGHVALMERADEVNGLISDFLDTCSPTHEARG